MFEITSRESGDDEVSHEDEAKSKEEEGIALYRLYVLGAAVEDAERSLDPISKEECGILRVNVADVKDNFHLVSPQYQELARGLIQQAEAYLTAIQKGSKNKKK
jgi:hypothetical protein